MYNPLRITRSQIQSIGIALCFVGLVSRCRHQYSSAAIWSYWVLRAKGRMVSVLCKIHNTCIYIYIHTYIGVHYKNMDLETKSYNVNMWHVLMKNVENGKIEIYLCAMYRYPCHGDRLVIPAHSKQRWSTWSNRKWWINWEDFQGALQILGQDFQQRSRT